MTSAPAATAPSSCGPVTSWCRASSRATGTTVAHGRTAARVWKASSSSTWARVASVATRSRIDGVEPSRRPATDAANAAARGWPAPATAQPTVSRTNPAVAAAAAADRRTARRPRSANSSTTVIVTRLHGGLEVDSGRAQKLPAAVLRDGRADRFEPDGISLDVVADVAVRRHRQRDLLRRPARRGHTGADEARRPVEASRSDTAEQDHPVRDLPGKSQIAWSGRRHVQPHIRDRIPQPGRQVAERQLLPGEQPADHAHRIAHLLLRARPQPNRYQRTVAHPEP